MVKYALALVPEEKRCLVSISSSGISFNLTGYRRFYSLEEAEDFKELWGQHFFNLNNLTVIEVKEK
jgi:hypothetical protein